MAEQPSHISRRSVLMGAGALATSLSLPHVVASPAAAAQLTGTNPLVRQRADAQVVRHSTGTYYMTATVPEYDRLIVRGAPTIQGLGAAAETVIWRRPASGEMAGYIWAPELHYVDGRWHMYFSAGTSADRFRQRLYVMRSSSADPRDPAWTMLGRIFTFRDSFTLDATTFTNGGTRYLAWAQSDPAINSNTNLYLSRMSSPSALTGPQARLSVPTYDWEVRGGVRVNEGPAVVVRNNRVFMAYSASAVDANYCLGLLTARASADLTNPASWSKAAQPVFATSTATSQYGPGHNGFTTAPDGSDILVYHSRDYRDINGDPLLDPNRNTRIQKLYWNADGTPDFGIPVPNGPIPVRLRSVNFPTYYVRHFEYRLRIDPNVRPLADSQFRIVTGLAGSGTVALESINFLGRYVRVRADGSVFVDPSDGSTGYAAQASFRQRAALAGGQGVSFESLARPGQYLRHANYVLTVSSPGGIANQDASFVLD